MRFLSRLAIVMCLAFAVHAKDGGRAAGEKKDKGGPDDARDVFLSGVPVYPGNVILARPTDHSVTANVMLNRDAKVRIRYRAEGQPERMTELFEMKAGEPREIVLDTLPANASCQYQLIDADTNVVMPGDCFGGTFHTRRPSDASFAFTVQADSHLDGQCLPDLYTITQGNALACKPDFHLDLGDTFMTGKIASREEAAKQYVAQRYYLGLIAHSAPLFMAIGNHDGEETFRSGMRDADGLAVWACKQRKRYFSNPVPDAFYTGDFEPQPYAGQLQDYYAWEWGGALFVVLDPYWYARAKKGGDPWSMTLGKPQYDWLAKTLRQSRARFKFVFIHQLVGGLDNGGRGGVEAASLFEWGGHEKGGTDSFATNRPGWERPIHKLFVETGVSAVFHGHDHFFAYQELDGVVYQLVPQPAHRNVRSHQAEEYGYRSGVFLPNSGFLRVAVARDFATVTYVRSRLPKDATPERPDGEVAFAYEIPASKRQ